MKDVAKHKLHELCAIIQKANPSSPPTPTPGDNPGAEAGIELFRIETFVAQGPRPFYLLISSVYPPNFCMKKLKDEKKHGLPLSE